MNHDVTNQTPPLAGSNAWRADPLLTQIGQSFSDTSRKELDLVGRFVMSSEAQDLARLANTETPRLRTHDRQGRRLDIVEFHPAYHALMRRSIASGLHSSIWENNKAEAGKRHQVRAARFYLTAELECGHLCPITMTSASLAALMASPKIFREWAPRVTTRKYDQASKAPVEKAGLTLGMGMTEKQGGTDVRANTTRAERSGTNGFYRLTGHKWFMSAPMSDAFLVLGQASEGLSCFLVPRLLGDGTSNGFRFQRIKDKLGNRSNASSEVEFTNALGEMVGEPGGTEGVDHAFAERHGVGIGAEIMGRGKFGVQTGPWTDVGTADEWRGWWGPNPPFHTPVFVLTHHPRPSIEMQGGTVFHFVDASPGGALELAREAADGLDVRIGGGPSVIRDFLAADLVDLLHDVQVPILLGRGVRLWDGVEGLEERYGIEAVASPSGVTHLSFTRR